MAPFFAALFGSFFGPFIARLLDTFFGRARRVELERDALSFLICENIDNLLTDCVKFWGLSAEELGVGRIALGAAIQARLHSLNMLQNDLFITEKTSLKNTKEEWRSLHRAATGGNADDDDRVADGGRLRAILQGGYQLRHGINRRRGFMRRGLLSG